MVADEAADAGIKGLVQMRVEGGAPQAPKAVTEGLSSQQIDDILKLCEAQEVGPFTWARCLTSQFALLLAFADGGSHHRQTCRRFPQTDNCQASPLSADALL